MSIRAVRIGENIYVDGEGAVGGRPGTLSQVSQETDKDGRRHYYHTYTDINGVTTTSYIGTTAPEIIHDYRPLASIEHSGGAIDDRVSRIVIPIGSAALSGAFGAVAGFLPASLFGDYYNTTDHPLIWALIGGGAALGVAIGAWKGYRWSRDA